MKSIASIVYNFASLLSNRVIIASNRETRQLESALESDLVSKIRGSRLLS